MDGAEAAATDRLRTFLRPVVEAGGLFCSRQLGRLGFGGGLWLVVAQAAVPRGAREKVEIYETEPINLGAALSCFPGSSLWWFY